MTVIGNFSKAAMTYDQFGDIQKISGEKLIDLISINPNSILDVGCGTGHFSKQLVDQFLPEKITLLDPSLEMLSQAKQTIKKATFIHSSVESFETKEKFDLITANASLHWTKNLDASIKKLQSLLTTDGVIVFSVFGPETYRELNSVYPFSSENKVEFDQTFHVKQFKFIKQFPNLLALLKLIKNTGTQGVGKFKGLWTPRALKKIESAYLKKYGAILATYQIFIVGVRA